MSTGGATPAASDSSALAGKTAKRTLRLTDSARALYEFVKDILRSVLPLLDKQVGVLESHEVTLSTAVENALLQVYPMDDSFQLLHCVVRGLTTLFEGMPDCTR